MTSDNILHEIKENKRANAIIIACFLIYASSMLAKSVFTAEMVTLIDVFKVNKAQLSMANTYYYITYALAQILLSVFINKIDVKKFLFLSILLTAGVSFSLAFITKIVWVYVLFAFNGLFQCGFWSGSVYITTKYLLNR